MACVLAQNDLTGLGHWPAEPEILGSNPSGPAKKDLLLWVVWTYFLYFEL